MATATIRPLAFASSPTYTGFSLDFFAAVDPIGDSDIGVCLQTIGDSKTCNKDMTFISNSCFVTFYFEDTGALPLDATISSVEITLTHTAGNPWRNDSAISYTYNAQLSQLYTFSGLDFDLGTVTTGPFTTNPVTSLPWVRSDLFNDNDAGDAGLGGIIVGLATDGDIFTESIDAIIMTVLYESGSNPQIRAYDGYTDRVFARIPNAT